MYLMIIAPDITVAAANADNVAVTTPNTLVTAGT